MSQTISDIFVEHLVQAGVQRIYGIVGDSLNPVVDAVRRNGKLQWIHVRHEEEAAFAENLGRRSRLDLGLWGDIRETINALLPRVQPKQDGAFLQEALHEAEEMRRNFDVYVNQKHQRRPLHLEFDQVKGYALSMTKLMLTGSTDEVVDIIQSNIRDIGGIL